MKTLSSPKNEDETKIHCLLAEEMVKLDTELFSLIKKYIMKSALSLLTVTVAISSTFVAPAAFGQSQQNGKNVQYLTCVEDSQGLMCKPQERDSQHQKPENLLPASQISTTYVPPVLSAAQLGFICNMLLGILYCVLPTGLVLAVFLHDKHDDYRTQLLSTQIEFLERVWHRNSHN